MASSRTGRHGALSLRLIGETLVGHWPLHHAAPLHTIKMDHL
jgi:hypothetical protein